MRQECGNVNGCTLAEGRGAGERGRAGAFVAGLGEIRVAARRAGRAAQCRCMLVSIAPTLRFFNSSRRIKSPMFK
jgi:hypothetical protein